MITISVQARRHDHDVKLIADTFLCGQELPFAEVLPPNVIEAVFRKHDAWFGGTYNAIYNTAIVLWAFLSQTLSDGKNRSCSAAVMRIIGFLMSVGKTVPSTNTGDYCAARAKLSVDAICKLASLVDRNTRHEIPEKWLFCGKLPRCSATSDQFHPHMCLPLDTLAPVDPRDFYLRKLPKDPRSDWIFKNP